MKTIEQAANEYFEKYGYNERSGEDLAFEAGAEFAQRWIPVEEELPEENYCGYVNFKIDNYVSCKKVDSQIEFLYLIDAYCFTHWRPIEYK